MTFLRKYWIRKERDRPLLLGVAATCGLCALVINYWQLEDRLAVKPEFRIKQKALSRTEEIKKFKETPYRTFSGHNGATTYYRVEEIIARPEVPELAGTKNEK